MPTVTLTAEEILAVDLVVTHWLNHDDTDPHLRSAHRVFVDTARQFHWCQDCHNRLAQRAGRCHRCYMAKRRRRPIAPDAG